MDDDQQFCLRWNNHQSTLISVFDTLLENETLVDCTLAAEGKFLKAHKVVLSACSPYFATLLQEQYDKHPIFILKDVKYQELRAMMDYMYRGEVNISQDQLAALLKAAESLQIKGLSDNRSGGGASQPKHPEHHRATMPGKLSGGYTLEQTKRARITGAAGPAMDASEMGSREGSSSPSRRRRKVRRRSIENAMTDVHDNSNSSQQPTQSSNAPGLGAITAAASALAAAAAGVPSSAAAAAALASTVVPLSATQQQQQSSSSAVTPAASGTTLSSSKKTDNVKGSTQQQQDAINTDNVQGSAAGSMATATPAMDTDAAATDASTADKSNHKQQQHHQKATASKDTASVTGSELVIEPKAEYDDEANDETVEDLTLDEEDMGMDDLDHNAGTSQGGEGSSQGYAPWQHDRSQDELLLATQEAQQRDPQDGSTGRLGGAADYLQRRRHSSRLKRSPLTSPLPHMLAAGSSSAATAVAGLPGSSAAGVIKFEPSTNLDENEEKYTLPSSSASHAGLRTEDDENDDDDDGGCMESEQPCDLRLPSHFKLNLVSMALQQAAVAAGAAMISGAAAGGGGGGGVGGTTVAGGGGTSTGMTTATQLQQAALHTIAAVATSHQTHGLHQSHAATHAFMNFPPGTAGGGGDTSPKRRYSSSSGGGGGGVTPVPGSLLTTATGVTGPSAASSTGLTASTPGGGPSTSAIVAPHTPSSTATSSAGSSSVAGISGAGGSGSAGATVGGGGVAGSGGAPANWGGAYTCERCGNSYARPHSLNRHVRFECGVEPKFECPICHKKSKHKHNLVLHMRTHQHR